MKLEYLVNNNRKLQLQKRFLEKALNKNLEDLNMIKQKAEVEILRDSFISSKQAQLKLQQIFGFSKDSLMYVKDIILFMKFDVGDQIQGKIQLDPQNDQESQIPTRKNSQPLTQQTVT